MSGSREQVLAVSLERRNQHTPWGFSVVGGTDQQHPIVVTKVNPGSPSERGLCVGDEITKVGDYDARDITHANVLKLFQSSGNTVKLVVKRVPKPKKTKSGLNAQSGELKDPFALPTTNFGPQKTIIFPPPCPFENDQEPVYCESYRFQDGASENEAENVKNQPYRTTPLVLPGAKAKHEAPTGTYLRHHPNPMVRAAPLTYEFLPQDAAMKQKVADSILTRIEKDDALAGKQIIRKQFNTPIGLYSDKNIVDTIQHATGVNPGVSRSPSFGKQNQGMGPRKTVMYDPAKSETYRALQEEEYGHLPVQEVTVPVQPKVFTPPQKMQMHRPPQSHTYDPTSHSTVTPNVQHHVPYVNSMGHSGDQIAQSGSFKRLMNLVLDESNY